MFCSLACTEEVMEKENEKYETAIFAGGCFWCMQPAFDSVEGVVKVVSGYTGGDLENPSYEDVAGGNTSHREAVRIAYDPSAADYAGLVDIFFKSIDPTDPGGQFADRGAQYTTAVFYTTQKQKEIAEKVKDELDKSGKFDKPVVTDILPAKSFYEAEEYHQDYYKKNPQRYKNYKFFSGRGPFLKKTWGPEEDIAQDIEKKD
jgi:methionine-S-sulfoxide reductase